MCAGLATWVVMHGIVSAVARNLSFLRGPLALLVALPCVVGGFVFGGWAVGLLNLIVGPVIGTIVLRGVVLLTGKA